MSPKGVEHNDVHGAERRGRPVDRLDVVHSSMSPKGVEHFLGAKDVGAFINVVGATIHGASGAFINVAERR